MFRNKYIKPLTKGQLSKLHGQNIRVHFLSNEYTSDRIWKVRLDKNTVVITDNKGDYRAFDNYKKHYNESTVGSGVLAYMLPQIPHDIEW